jgi:hypothetical protein
VPVDADDVAASGDCQRGIQALRYADGRVVTRQTRASAAAYPATIARVSSVEHPSATITSNGASTCCRVTAASARPMLAASFLTGISTLICGGSSASGEAGRARASTRRTIRRPRLAVHRRAHAPSRVRLPRSQRNRDAGKRAVPRRRTHRHSSRTNAGPATCKQSRTDKGTLREQQFVHRRARAVTRLGAIPSSCGAFVPETSRPFPCFPSRRSMVIVGATIGRRRNYQGTREAEAGKRRSAARAFFAGKSRMGRAGIEPATLGLKVPCSTN